MIPKLQGRIRIRAVLWGILGLGVASAVLIVWTNKKSVIRYNAADDFHDHTTGLISPFGKQMNEDKPGTQGNKQSAFKDITALNDGLSLSDKAHSQTVLYKAYGHVKTILFFIGYSRSRHTLLGSLLDAHPHMVIANEIAAFSSWSLDPNRWMNNAIYAYYDMMYKSSERQVNKGVRSKVSNGSVANATSSFRYYVPNQWQGTFDQYIEVIGDKRGGTVAMAMKRRSQVDAVHLLEKAADAKVKFVHVVRNPFDNIATKVLEHNNIKARYRKQKVKINAPKELDEEINIYFGLAEGCNKAREAFPGSVIDVPSMEIVKKPVETLRKVCQFLEITCTEKYLQDCASTVDPVPSITRDFVEWTAERKNTVYDMMKKYSFFEGYSFDK